MSKQGPTLRTIPAQSETVCNGCTYLHTSPGMRGHRHVTNDYACQHPDFRNETIPMSTKRGRSIHINHEGSCTTPQWCPFVQPASINTE